MDLQFEYLVRTIKRCMCFEADKRITTNRLLKLHKRELSYFSEGFYIEEDEAPPRGGPRGGSSRGAAGAALSRSPGQQEDHSARGVSTIGRSGFGGGGGLSLFGGSGFGGGGQRGGMMTTLGVTPPKKSLADGFAGDYWRDKELKSGIYLPPAVFEGELDIEQPDQEDEAEKRTRRTIVGIVAFVIALILFLIIIECCLTDHKDALDSDLHGQSLAAAKNNRTFVVPLGAVLTAQTDAQKVLFLV